MNKSNEVNEDEVFEKKESKVKPTMQKIGKYKFVILLILLILVLAIVEITTGAITDLFASKEMGNSQGNITNFGYSVEKNGDIYYVSPSEDMYSTQINCIKSGETDSTVIYQGGYDIRALNIVGNKIYFISISDDETDAEDGIDNKIYKMNLDGSDLTVVSDNDFSYDSYDMQITKNRIYYVGTDYNVYKMDLNGGNKELVAETGTGYVAMNDQYIIYDKIDEETNDFVTYIRELNGGEQRAITGSKVFTPIIYEGYIYYINAEEHLAKVLASGGEEQEITNYAIYNMNISNGKIYYLNYKNEESEDYTIAIYKMNLDGGEQEVIKELENYSSYLNIVGDYAYYMDMNEEKSYIQLVNVNDLTEKRLYEWSYANEEE